MTNIFAGTWRLNVTKSQFDPKYVPKDGVVVFEPDGDGYLMKAEGTSSSGERCQERAQRLLLDGKEHPMPDIPGLTGLSTRPTPNRIEAEGRMNGEVVGRATYDVSEDGKTLTATARGTGVSGPFETRAVFERVS